MILRNIVSISYRNKDPDIAHHYFNLFYSLCLSNEYRLITFYNKLPTNIENIFSGTSSGNIKKAYLTVGNLVMALVYTNKGICINYK